MPAGTEVCFLSSTGTGIKTLSQSPVPATMVSWPLRPPSVSVGLPPGGPHPGGGRKAYREMEELVKKGHKGGLVADAPRGPRFVSKLGIIYLAKRTGLPIIPVIWSADRYWKLRSWDRTIIPKAFSHIVALYADSYLFVPPDASRQECEKYRCQLDSMLNRIMYQTDHFFNTPAVNDPRQIDVPEPIPLPD